MYQIYSVNPTILNSLLVSSTETESMELMDCEIHYTYVVDLINLLSWKFSMPYKVWLNINHSVVHLLDITMTRILGPLLAGSTTRSQIYTASIMNNFFDIHSIVNVFGRQRTYIVMSFFIPSNYTSKDILPGKNHFTMTT